MTRRVKGTAGGPNVVIVEPESPQACELCGAVEETRPYGPGGKRICFACAMKDPTGTTRRMHRYMDLADLEDN